MAVAAVKCARCGVKLGIVANLWIRIGDKYLAQVSDSNDDPDLEISNVGSVRIGAADTVVGGCGQYIFLVKSVTIKSTVDGRRRVEPKIQKSLPWVVDTTVNGDEHISSPTRGQSLHSPQPAHRQKRQRQTSDVEPVEDAQLEFELDSEVASAFRSVLSYVEREVAQLHEELRAVRTAGDERRKKQATAVQDEPSKTKAELDQLKDGNLRLREELEKTKQVAREAIDTAKGFASELSSLKGDVEQLRAELNRRVVPVSANNFQYGGRTSLKRSSLLRDGDDDSISNPPKRVAVTPELTSSQHSSPTASAIKRSGFLSRPARRSSGIFGEKKHHVEEGTGAKDN
ncbi:hypothetical protein G7Z17_g8060 [Cylindrodendrum hubeiense]|uniref:Uncharacterized protein n=1 Tax=Cylindrodendrum hubeiense TaxID=595255 RepID=A0A9P5LDJ9_9HYPO|nr:hypothetical protein G7Z17_g8060 [Cylindrodendrum hubeiense]